jgi:hypothetical protein
MQRGCDQNPQLIPLRLALLRFKAQRISRSHLGEMLVDMMVGCVEQRFGAVRALHPMQRLSDNGSIVAAHRTIEIALALDLDPSGKGRRPIRRRPLLNSALVAQDNERTATKTQVKDRKRPRHTASPSRGRGSRSPDRSHSGPNDPSCGPNNGRHSYGAMVKAVAAKVSVGLADPEPGRDNQGDGGAGGNLEQLVHVDLSLRACLSKKIQ